MAEKVITRYIEDEMKTSYLTYAMSVIMSRAIPDVRDGFKPVHRRVLYAMHQLGLSHNRPFKKAATVVGEVLGKYHPHGDQAIYDTLVRMAQDFSLRVPLVQGQGNFGSIDGDSAAAMRYTETRMARIADEMLRDIQKETVDFQNNFDDSLKEPVVMPSAFPNLLVNGTSGIAVGMATSLPPHNLRNAIEAVIHYIDHRDCSVDDLIAKIQGPDFPTGGVVYNFNGVRQGYATGKGLFKIRGRVRIEESKNNRESIIITEIPYQVNKSEMIKKIAELAKTDVITGITEIRDESGKEGLRVVIELKQNIHSQVILNQLFKHTTLETTFSINNVVIVNKSPKVLNLKELIIHFTRHRLNVVTRRIQYDLKKAEERSHIVEGLMKAIDQIDEVIAIIRSSETVDIAKEELISRFTFTEIQAKAIMDMRLSRLVALEIEKLKEEWDALQKAIVEYRKLLADPEKIYKLIKEELIEIAKTFGTDRKTEINLAEMEDLRIEAYIQRDNSIISISKMGYIKCTSPQLYREQHRGGHGVRAISGKNQNDVTSLLFSATTHDTILFFTNLGKAYYLKAHEIPMTLRTAKGVHVKILLNFSEGEEIQGYHVFHNFQSSQDFILVTSQGIGKKGEVKDFINAKKRGIQAINLTQGDTLVGSVAVSPGDHIVICSRRGLAVRTEESQFRLMGRGARGVRAIRIGSGDEVVGVEKVIDGECLAVVTENGLGKRVNLADFSPHNRGSKGQIYMKINERTGEIAGIKSVRSGDGVLVITSSGSLIRLRSDEIKLLGRPAQGVKVVEVKKPNFVVDMTSLRPLEEMD